MKQILAFFLLLAVLNGHAQKSTGANYEAAGWKTWETYLPGELVMPALPSATQSKLEVSAMKKKSFDEKKLSDILYWNAGAPSYRWNQLGNSLVSWENVDAVLRTPTAWMNIAVYDATVLAWREKLKHKRPRPQAIDPALKPVVAAPTTYSYPCEHSVTASAAAHVLAYFYPKKADSIMQLARTASQSRVDAGVQFPSDAEAGWKLGEQVAKKIIEKARADGSAAKWDGSMNKDPKKWTGNYPMGIMAAKMVPMTLRSPDQFRPAPPPDFAAEMEEMKSFKRNFRSNSQAYFWANVGYEFWTDLASQKMFEYRMSDDAPAVARIYTILHTASHDVVISVMDAKYAHWGIRPSQYDTTYKPLISTPPFPGYPSGHAMGAGAASTVLSYFFPADAKEFRKLAQDCADSRFYAGIHFKTDNEVALTMGREVASFIVEEWMKKASKAAQVKR